METGCFDKTVRTSVTPAVLAEAGKGMDLAYAGWYMEMLARMHYQSLMLIIICQKIICLQSGEKLIFGFPFHRRGLEMM